MGNKKKGKKLSLQKIKIAKLNRNGLYAIKGGTEIPIDFSNSHCPTDTCPTIQQCDSIPPKSQLCRTDERFCGGN